MHLGQPSNTAVYQTLRFQLYAINVATTIVSKHFVFTINQRYSFVHTCGIVDIKRPNTNANVW